MSEHTKGPWRAEGTDVVAMVEQYPSVIADCLNHASVGRKDSEENARRIVACVNACASIPTYQLTGVDGEPTDLGGLIDQLRASAERSER